NRPCARTRMSSSDHDGSRGRTGVLVPGLVGDGSEATASVARARRHPTKPVSTSGARSSRVWIATGLVVALVALMLFARFGALTLVTPDEGRNAQIASEMERSGSWLIPTYNGATYLDKPAFFFRAVALSLGALGESEAASRLPSAIAALMLAGVVFAFVRSRFGLRTGVLAVA